MVQRWMLGVSHHWYGRSRDTGIRPRSSSWPRTDQWAKLGKLTMAILPTRTISRTIMRGRRSCCRLRLRMTTSMEPSVIVGEARVEVAVEHRQALADAGLHRLLADLDAAAP